MELNHREAALALLGLAYLCHTEKLSEELSPKASELIEVLGDLVVNPSRLVGELNPLIEKLGEFGATAK